MSIFVLMNICLCLHMYFSVWSYIYIYICFSWYNIRMWTLMCFRVCIRTENIKVWINIWTRMGIEIEIGLEIDRGGMMREWTSRHSDDMTEIRWMYAKAENIVKHTHEKDMCILILKKITSCTEHVYNILWRSNIWICNTECDLSKYNPIARPKKHVAQCVHGYEFLCRARKCT